MVILIFSFICLSLPFVCRSRSASSLSVPFAAFAKEHTRNEYTGQCNDCRGYGEQNCRGMRGHSSVNEHKRRSVWDGEHDVGAIHSERQLFQSTAVQEPELTRSGMMHPNPKIVFIIVHGQLRSPPPSQGQQNPASIPLP